MSSAEGANAEAGQQPELNAIQVCVRVRPLNNRERDEGHRCCVSFDDASRQVVLTAVDKNTLVQLRGQTAKGYAFDRRYGQDDTSDSIYGDVVAQLVENCFKGYNATVLAYGQTGSGKTHTMAGGVGIHGRPEKGITPQVIQHVFAFTDALRKKMNPGEKVTVAASALEIYNEELRDLSTPKPDESLNWGGTGVSGGKATNLKLAERPAKDGRVVPEVIGLTEREMNSAEELMTFFKECFQNRATSSTKLNDQSSRSHALFTVSITRTVVTFDNELDSNFRAKVRTEDFMSKLHLVDLAGSERVKRSGVSGKELKEATHINSGLLALGNVIVALAPEGGSTKRGHIPYRDSKLTRLLQDSLGGNSLTVLISCISPSEADFEETNNTLKYANRACSIKNTPLPNKYTMLEEDLLPMLPTNTAGFGLVQLQSLLEEHGRMKEARERRERDKREKEQRRIAALQSLRDQNLKTPGFQRLRAAQYDEMRRRLAGKGGSKVSIPSDVTIYDETLTGARRNSDMKLHTAPATPAGTSGYLDTRDSRDGRPGSAASSRRHITNISPRTPGFGLNSSQQRPGTADAYQTPASTQKINFDDWLQTQDAEHIRANGALRSVELPDPEDAAAGEAEADPPVVVSNKNKFKRPSAIAAPVQRQNSIPAYNPMDEAAADASVDSTSVTPALPDKVDRLSLDDAGESAMATDLKRTSTHDSQSGAGSYDDEIDAEMDMPRLLARFKVNQHDTLAVFKANTKEDFKDVISLLPENTPLPASDKMTYLLARLEIHRNKDIVPALEKVAYGDASMNEVIGPAVGCLMATFGTNMIASCIFDFEDPEELELYNVDERIELWGLQIPHNSQRPPLQIEGAEVKEDEEKEQQVVHWTSVDRLNMSIGLLYALCNYALDNDVRCGFCVPRPQLLKRWLQAGVKMTEIKGNMKLIYPPSAHDYEYYKTSTVAYFMVDSVKEALEKVLSIVPAQ